ncbi:cell wall / vacuolar inhibitor of fructosidase 2-like [Primulina huaijiensis]|uniref:cell wall / vacuolar inhibitor of fructosidase 2-like n=1 Tax=Primulina huaijiensis TaxID=1492673 RepID=UPI003CC6E3C4
MAKQVFAIVIVLVFVFFFSQSNASSANNMSLIESVRKKTFDYKLCVSSLKSNPHSFNTDVKGLARIMMDVIISKVDGILGVIRELVKKTSDPRMLECLNNGCYVEYDLSKDNMKYAIEYLQSNSFREALTLVDDAYIGDQEGCEDSFAELKIKSPMTAINNHFAALCKITEDIISILFK